MATIVNNPGGPTERVVEKSDSSGWAVAVIILIAVLAIGGFIWLRTYGAPAAAPTEQGNQQDESNTPGNANINLTLPPLDDDDDDTNDDTPSGTGTNSGGLNSTTTP